MKIISLNWSFLIPYIFFITCCNSTKKVEWAEGKIKSIERFKRLDNVVVYNGKCTYYHKNGNKEKVVFYKKNFLTKVRKIWYEGGELKYKDKIIGYTKFVDSINTESEYVYYKADYISEHYYQNKKVESCGKVIGGKKQGEWMFYDKEGNLLKKEVYLNDSIIKSW